MSSMNCANMSFIYRRCVLFEHDGLREICHLHITGAYAVTSCKPCACALSDEDDNQLDALCEYDLCVSNVSQAYRARSQ